MEATKVKRRNTIRRRIRKKIRGSAECPRLSVFRSNKQIYAQIIDDVSGRTLVSASSVDRDLRPRVQGLKKAEQAKLVGELVAKRALAQGITQVVFDRGGHPYHGRIRALAEASREGGLDF